MGEEYNEGESESTDTGSTDGSSTDTSSTDSSSTSSTDTQEDFVPLGIASTEKFSMPEKYSKIWGKWSTQRGILKIKPEMKFAYNTKATASDNKSSTTKDTTTFETSVTYLNNDKSTQPVTQTFPIEDVKITPHMTSFEFFDTSEGTVGIEKATYQHMVVEFQVTFSTLLLYYYNYANYAKEYSGASQWMGLSDLYKQKTTDVIDNAELENRERFIRIRQRFLQEYSGWACTFTSNVFGVFQGVITDLQYNVDSGDTDGIYSIKIEEVIIPDASDLTQTKADNEADIKKQQAQLVSDAGNDIVGENKQNNSNSGNNATNFVANIVGSMAIGVAKELVK